MASFLFFTIYPPGGHGLMVSFFCVPLKGGKDPRKRVGGFPSIVRHKTHPPAIRPVPRCLRKDFFQKQGQYIWIK